jgi:hypothetical protein
MFVSPDNDEHEPLLLTASPFDKIDASDHSQQYEELYDHHLSMFSPTLPTKSTSTSGSSRHFFGINLFGNVSKPSKEVTTNEQVGIDMTQHGEMVYFPTTLQPIGSPGNEDEYRTHDTLPTTTLSRPAGRNTNPPLSVITNEEDLMTMQFAGLGMSSTPYSSPDMVIDGFEQHTSTPPPIKHTETLKRPTNDVLWFNVAGKQVIVFVCVRY